MRNPPNTSIQQLTPADSDDDQPAINLYTKLGTREDVLHFDIPVAR